ncbi:CBN-NHR-33 protein [Aphelenchoides avenae]|nr:CBN-NHR-33 protein [Aphelenchus avenae]
MVEGSFFPFNNVPAPDKKKIFESFYCMFSNLERAYRSYVTFEETKSSLIMPDGGYVHLDELDQFYGELRSLLVVAN